MFKNSSLVVVGLFVALFVGTLMSSFVWFMRVESSVRPPAACEGLAFEATGQLCCQTDRLRSFTVSVMPCRISRVIDDREAPKWPSSA